MRLPYWIKASLINYLSNTPNAIKPNPAILILIKEWSQSSLISSDFYTTTPAFPELVKLALTWSTDAPIPFTLENSQAVLKILETFDGYNWVLLRKEQAYLREGDLMKNCVKDYFKTGKDTSLYSLRDLNNHPHATLEIREILVNHIKFKSVIQISGKANSILKDKYQEHLKKFLNYFHEFNWAIPNNATYAINNLIFDPLKNQVINLVDLSYYKGNLDLIKFKGVMPDKLFIDGDLNLTQASPKSLSTKLIVTGNLTLSGAGFKRPTSWQCSTLVKNS